MSPKKPALCGELVRSGKKCSRPAGWGTPNDSGPCKQHGAAAREKENAQKTTFLATLAQILLDPKKSLRNALRKAKISESTLWHWRQEDEAFDKAVLTMRGQLDQSRVEMVEDAMIGQLVGGTAPASLFIWYLSNRRPDRWKRLVDPASAAAALGGLDPEDVLIGVVPARDEKQFLQLAS